MEGIGEAMQALWNFCVWVLLPLACIGLIALIAGGVYLLLECLHHVRWI